MGSESGTPINVFVHLAAGLDAELWQARRENKTLIGINHDPSPYGYARAEEMGCLVKFASCPRETPLGKVHRLALRVLLGFDYVHAARNIDAILASDVIWTHTESQFLAIAVLLKRKRQSPARPKLIGQAVWLLDRWPHLSALRRKLYSSLVAELDALVVLSPKNYKLAKSYFPGKRVELVLFGIPNENYAPVTDRNTQPINVLSVGNDRDRDWKTAIAALGNQDNIRLRIVSTTAKQSLAMGRSNVEIVRLQNNEQLRQLYDDASVVLVPLKHNYHASGITVMQEAALLGVPTVATDTGGLRAYFDDTAIKYVPVSDPAAILLAVREVCSHPARMRKLAENAQRRAISPALGCNAYIGRHVDLSRELLSPGIRA